MAARLQLIKIEKSLSVQSYTIPFSFIESGVKKS